MEAHSLDLAQVDRRAPGALPHDLTVQHDRPSGLGRPGVAHGEHAPVVLEPEVQAAHVDLTRYGVEVAGMPDARLEVVARHQPVFSRGPAPKVEALKLARHEERSLGLERLLADPREATSDLGHAPDGRPASLLKHLVTPVTRLTGRGEHHEARPLDLGAARDYGGPHAPVAALVGPLRDLVAYLEGAAKPETPATVGGLYLHARPRSRRELRRLYLHRARSSGVRETKRAAASTSCAACSASHAKT